MNIFLQRLRELTGEDIRLGDIVLSETSHLVEDLAELRIRTLNKLRTLTHLPIPSYHTYKDFLLEQQRNEPTRTESIGYGRSVTAHDSSIDGYIRYVQKSDPELANFFLLRQRIYMPAWVRQFHAHIVGKSRCGKSHMGKQLIWNDFHEGKSSVFVVEPSGTLCKEILKWRCHPDSIDKVVYIDPYIQREAKEEDVTPVFNPLQIGGLTDQSIDIALQELVPAFGAMMGTEWTPNMRGLIKNCLHVLLRRNRSTLLDLLRLCADSGNDDLVAIGAKNRNPSVSNFFQTEYYNLKTTKRAVYLKLQSLLASESFSRLTIGESTFNIEKLMNSKGKLVLFNLSKGSMGIEASNAFGCFVVGIMLFYARQREKVPEKAWLTPCRLHIDECQNYISKTITEILSEALKYRLSLTLYHQFLKQIKNPEILDSILANSEFRVIGANEKETYQKMANNSEFGFHIDELYKLKNRQFWVKIGGKKPFKFRTTGFLAGDSYNMKPWEYTNVLKWQIAKHYRKVEKVKPAEAETPKEEEFTLNL